MTPETFCFLEWALGRRDEYLVKGEWEAAWAYHRIAEREVEAFRLPNFRPIPEQYIPEMTAYRLTQ